MSQSVKKTGTAQKTRVPGENPPAAKRASTAIGAPSSQTRPASKKRNASAPSWAAERGAGARNAVSPKRLVRLILAHAAVIISLMYLVFFVIDRINTAMEFINNDATKLLLALLAILSIVNAYALIFAKKTASRGKAKGKKKTK